MTCSCSRARVSRSRWATPTTTFSAPRNTLRRRTTRTASRTPWSVSSSRKGASTVATDKPMQLGMVGLGRMGAGIVRRLLRDGHRCVGYDVFPDAVTAIEADGAEGATSLDGVRRQARTPARRLGDGARWRDHLEDDPRRRRGARARRRDHRRRQYLLPRRPPACRRVEGEGHPPRGRRHERRRLGPRARLLPDDRRRAGGRRAPRAVVRLDRSRYRGRGAHARAHRRAEHGRARLLPLRRKRRGPLREDGPQRHRVRPHGRLRRGAQHHQERRHGHALA